MMKKYLFPSFIVFLILLLLCCSNSSKKNTMVDTLLKTFGDTWTSHDIDTMVSLFTEDCIYEEVVSDDIYEGHEGVATYAKETFTKYPDFHLEIALIKRIDNWAMMEWTMKGTDYSIPKDTTGVTFAIKGASIIELKNGKIYKIRDYWGYPL